MLCIQLVGVAATNMNFFIAYVIVKDDTTQSYRWMLECLRNLLGHHVNPHVIFTDRE